MTTETFLAARPRVRPDLVQGPALVRGAARVHLLKDPRSGRRLEIGPKEHFLISRMDGSRTLAEIGQDYAGTFGARLGEAQWGQLLRLLHGRGLMEGSPAPAAGPPPGPGHPPNGILAGRTRMVADAPALMDRLHRTTTWARRPAVLTVLTALAAGVLVAVAVQAGTLWRQTEETARQPVLLFAIGCVLWCGLALHELAHGLFARAWGGKVTEIGLRWFCFATYLYCEVEDVQFLGSRGRKVATACAGAFANLLFLVPFYALWALLPAGADGHSALGALLLLGTVLGLANLLPLPPLDGYKALAHALGVVELAGGSRTFLALAVRRMLRRGPGVAAYPVRLRLLYGGFALLLAVQSAALLVLCGAALRSVFPDRYAMLAWFLPPALLAAVLLLWALGGLGRSLRERRATATPEAAPVPRTVPHPLSPRGVGPPALVPAALDRARNGEMSGPDSKTET
ncbi:hypothetical protein, partial [Streptomyces sp. NPDC059597]|uniref:hypothetical protein n=1 Tax=Streptomyces sp. NPDC059597 TaxID=3346879 RepID=UPI0036871429